MLGRYTTGPRPEADDSSRSPEAATGPLGVPEWVTLVYSGHARTLAVVSGVRRVGMTLMGRQPGEDVLREHWALVAGVGAVMAILGLLALGNLWDATVISTFIIGIVLIVAGVAQIGFAFMAREAGGLLRGITGAIGILSIVVGIDIAADPKGAVVAVALAIAFLLLFNGIMRIIGALMNRTGMWVLGLIVGIIDILLGAWIWTGIPVSGLAIGLFVGIDLLIGGIMWIILGIGARGSAQPAAPAAA